MIDAFQLATQGVGPGWSTFGFATGGFGFDVEVIIRPSSGGGGYVPTAWDAAQPYEVVVIIKYKGKTWEQRKKVSALAARSLEKVLVSFRSYKTRTIEIVAKLNSILKREIHVNMFRK
jgi:hypothetical protein